MDLVDVVSDLLPPTEPDYRAALFPRLTEEQLGRIAPLGSRRAFRAGEEVFHQGDQDLHFYTVLRGQLDLVRPSLMGEDLIASLAPGEFTGEVSLLARRRSLVTGRMRTDGELLDVPPAGVRELVVAEAELSGLLMRTFILRRVFLITRRLGDTVLAGTRNSAGTIRLMEFLTRNGHPYTYLDVEEDAEAQALLDQFQVRPSDVPVLICRRSIVLRNPGNEQVADVLGFNVGVDLAPVRDLVVVGAGPAGLSAWRRAEHRMARRVRGARSQGLRENWTGSTLGRARARRMVPSEGAILARILPAGRLRAGRHAGRERQARRLRRWRGEHLRAARPQGAARVTRLGRETQGRRSFIAERQAGRRQ